MPSFATSDDGKRIVALHLLGYPLAATQGDLTEVQAAFLLEALPPVIRRMHSGEPDSPQGLNPQAADLFTQMKARQHGKRT